MTPILITLPSKVVEIECAVAAAVVVRPRFFFLSFLRCHADPDCQNDLTDALPVEVDLRSWRIMRTTACQKDLNGDGEQNVTAADGL